MGGVSVKLSIFRPTKLMLLGQPGFGPNLFKVWSWVWLKLHTYDFTVLHKLKLGPNPLFPIWAGFGLAHFYWTQIGPKPGPKFCKEGGGHNENDVRRKENAVVYSYFLVSLNLGELSKVWAQCFSSKWKVLSLYFYNFSFNRKRFLNFLDWVWVWVGQTLAQPTIEHYQALFGSIIV